jgi:hypothetical protein
VNNPDLVVSVLAFSACRAFTADGLCRICARRSAADQLT